MSDPLLSVEGLTKHYPVREGLLNRQTGTVRAVDGIDFAVRRGETVGLLGESGCGKSTAARTTLRIEEPTDGEIRFDGDDVSAYEDAELRAFRRRAQLVLQDPTGSFDPRMTVGASVEEPLLIQGIRDGDVRESVVADLLERVGLSADIANRYPGELSGGQKQRAALARALVVDPDLIVADEPVSALDVSIQAQLLQLLADLQDAHDLAVVFITHDMSVVREVCDRVAVMYAGEIVERGPTDVVFDSPRHPYTAALINAVPEIGGHGTSRAPLSGDPPDPAAPPQGCRFHPRCPDLVAPAGVDVDRDTYQRLLRLHNAVTHADGPVVDDEGLTAMTEDVVGADPIEADTDDVVGDGSYGDDDADDVVSDGPYGDDREDDEPDARTLVRTSFDLPRPSTVPDDDVAAALERTLAAAVDGGDPALADELRSPCVATSPPSRETDVGSTAACHLHDPDVAVSGERSVVRSIAPDTGGESS